MNETWEAELPIEASLKGFFEDLMADEWAVYLWGRGSGAHIRAARLGQRWTYPGFMESLGLGFSGKDLSSNLIPCFVCPGIGECSLARFPAGEHLPHCLSSDMSIRIVFCLTPRAWLRRGCRFARLFRQRILESSSLKSPSFVGRERAARGDDVVSALGRLIVFWTHAACRMLGVQCLGCVDYLDMNPIR